VTGGVTFGDVESVQYVKDPDVVKRYTVFWEAVLNKQREAYRQQKKFQKYCPDPTTWWRSWAESLDEEEDRFVKPRVWDFVFERDS